METERYLCARVHLWRPALRRKQPDFRNSLYSQRTFVSRFCSNSSAIQRSGSRGQSANLQFAGVLSIGFSEVATGLRNTGTSQVSVEAVCIEAVGIVPVNYTLTGPSATTIQFAISPESAFIRPGQVANLSVRFTGGSGVYFIPQGGVGITIIASDGSSLSEDIQPCCTLTTNRSETPLVSVRNASLLAGIYPVLSALLSFNSSSSSPIAGVGVYVNGKYIATAGVGHNTTFPDAPNQYSVLYHIRIIEPGRLSVAHGVQYTITFIAFTYEFTETWVSVAVEAV